MIAPAAFEDLTFPQQTLIPWSSYESNQWVRAYDNYFNQITIPSASYGAPIEIGAALAGGIAKYNGGAMADNGVIYAPGHLQTNWLLIDTYTDNISVTGSIGAGATNGAFYSPRNRAVYCATSNPRMYKLPIDNNSGSFVALPALGSQYFPFLLSYDGVNAYTTGTFNTDTMVRYDTSIESGSNMGIATSNDRGNGCLGPNGKMYWSPAGPAGTRNYIEFDPATDTYTSFGTPGGNTRYGMCLAPDGFMYSLPSGANPFVRINPKTLQLTDLLTPNSSTSSASSCIGADGRIYMVGGGAIQLTIYDWRTNTVEYVTLPSAGGYSSISMGVYGDLYLTPWTASKVVKIPLTNNRGRILRPILEMNGILGRHQPGI
jgi:hypothetical protein